MASIYKPSYTKTDPKTGKKVTKKLSKWYIKYRDAQGIVRKVAGFCDKTATQQLAAQLEKEAELEKLGIVDGFVRHRRTPLSEHIGDFEKHLRGKGNTPEHVRLTMDRVRSIVSQCQFVFIDEITASAVERFLLELRDQGRSRQTSNHYLRAIKQFCRWLEMDRRHTNDPIKHLTKLNVDVDRRHDRRAIEDEEFQRLLAAAATGPEIEAVTGPDRAIIYMMAAWTGYRRNELASITGKDLDLSSAQPSVTVAAAYSKRRRADKIPLHPAVVEQLKGWLATKGDLPQGQPLFPLKTASGKPRKTSKMMQRDLERARKLWIEEAPHEAERHQREQSEFLKYHNEEGLFADFHANRHTFITNLGKSGVTLAVAQMPPSTSISKRWAFRAPPSSSPSSPAPRSSPAKAA